MSIRIVTDSASDIPTEIISRYGIQVVPLHIHLGEETYLDGINITKETFYHRLPDFDPAPSTATPGPDTFIQHYEILAEQGAQAILSIHISESLSATIQSARLAAKQFTRIPVSVIDSGQLSLGFGFIVEKAAQLTQADLKVEEIVKNLSEIMKRTYVFAALDTLEYLRRSGRMNGAIARFGEILKLKPLLVMNQGSPSAYRVRTRKKAIERLFEWLDEFGPYEKLAVVHAGVQERAEVLREQVRNYLPDDDIPIVQITPVLGANLGIGALGFAAIAKRDKE
jgi:DegV family protein with EDD domain